MLSISSLRCSLSENHDLLIDNLILEKGESLLVVGDNASGKSILVQILVGEHNDYTGDVKVTANFASLSFEIESQTLAEDRENDRSDYLAQGVDMGRTAQEVICAEFPDNSAVLSGIIKLLSIEALLEKPFKVLSTGETRKVLMAKALLSQPDLLILDEPYAGLDIESQLHLTKVIEQLIAQGTSIVLFDFYHQGLPKTLNKLVYLQEGSVAIAGEVASVTSSKQWQELTKAHYTLPHHLPDCINYDHVDPNKPLVSLKDISVSFLDNKVFSHLSWQFEQGQHWKIIGPNGCGKSTLLSMISGDSTKAYGQQISLFGVQRGSGESIWDIKRHYGVVSAQLHRDYRVSTNLLQTVLSGFFDSIGLYDAPSRHQVNIAREWLLLLGLENKEQQAFSQLSYGEQRLVLIARAVVKLPLVLILDEPCQGLDNKNREKVLALVDYIAERSNTHILFVSHDVRDVLKCITHHLTFTKGEEGYMATATTRA